MEELVNKIKTDILLKIHTTSMETAKCSLHLRFKDLYDTFNPISNMIKDNVISPLDPINTIGLVELQVYKANSIDYSGYSHYVELNKDYTLLSVFNKLNKSTYSSEVFVYSTNPDKIEEIKNYFNNTQFKNINFKLEDKVIPNKKEKKEKPSIPDKLNFISDKLVNLSIDYLKLFQILAIDANRLDILGKYVGSENVDLISSETRIATFSEKLAIELQESNYPNLPSIPIITQDKKIIVIAEYKDLGYIPSILVIDTRDQVVHYTILGNMDTVQEINRLLKKVLSTYPSTLDNRFRHLSD